MEQDMLIVVRFNPDGETSWAEGIALMLPVLRRSVRGFRLVDVLYFFFLINFFFFSLLRGQFECSTEHNIEVIYFNYSPEREEALRVELASRFALRAPDGLAAEAAAADAAPPAAHRREHAGGKPHVCDIFIDGVQCGHAFASRKNLVRHKRTHFN